MALTEGQMLGPYRVEQQLGSGGMATIYKAYHARLDRHVAIKMMHQAFLQDATFVARFEREAQIVARLEHPNIVPIFDFAEYENQPYLVMKYIEGRTLKGLIERADGLPLSEIRRILPLLAAALDYAHRQGVLHRDIKPSNIILDKDGTPYLTDFGLARLAQLGESTLSSDVLLGTPHYISPEQAQGQRDLTHQTDLYSFGVVIYELLVGRVPFSADTPFAVIHDHIYRPLPLPSSINPEIPAAVEAVLLRALAKTPADRYPSATALVAALLDALSAAGVRDLNPQRRQIASSTEARAREQSAPGMLPPAAAAAAMAAAGNAAPLPDQQTVYVQTPPPSQRFDFADAPPGADAAKRKRIEASIDLGHIDINMDKVEAKIEEWGEKLEAWGERVSSGESEIAINFGGRDDELADPDDPAAIRRRAERQVKKRTEFAQHLGIYTVINVLMWVIFFGMNDGIMQTIGDADVVNFMNAAPWPLFVLFGWGAGLVADAIETYYTTGKRAARRIVTIHRAFEDKYGPRWWETTSKAELRKTRKVAEKPLKGRQDFFEHLGVYVMINSLLWIIFGMGSDALAELANVGFISAFPWPLIVMAGWGIGLFAHYMEDVRGAKDNQRAVDQQIEAELAFRSGQFEKTKRKNDFSGAATLDDLGVTEVDAPADRRVRLSGDGELTDSMVQEIDPRTRRRDR